MERDDHAVRDHWARMAAAGGLPQVRAYLDDLGDSLVNPDGVSFEACPISEIAAEWVVADARGSAVLYLHGGAYMVGSIRSYRHVAAEIARLIQGRILLVEYRLAPENFFPSPIEDAVAAYRYMIEEGGLDPGRIAIMGDSAGGNLTMVTLLALRDRGLPMPACAVCWSPWVDSTLSGSSFQTKADVDPCISREAARVGRAAYFNGADPMQPPAAILERTLHGLPPLMIQVGSDEVLLDDSIMLAARAAQDEVEVTLEVWPRMAHIFQYFFPILDKGRAALVRSAEFIRRNT
jgi:acetyl esterase/lipase